METFSNVPTGTLQPLPYGKQLEINIIKCCDGVNCSYEQELRQISGIVAEMHHDTNVVVNIACSAENLDHEPEAGLELADHGIEHEEIKERKWVDTRPPMDSKYHNRHEEYVASGQCPKVWYGVL